MTFCYKKDKDKFDEFVKFVDMKKDTPGAVMPVLQEAQRIFGYIPEPIVDYIALKLNKPSSEIFGVATFYSQFTLTPRGEHEICICLGTACYVKGADKLLDEFCKTLNVKPGETTADGKFSVIETRCVGECGSAPVVTVDGTNIPFVKKDMIDQILFDAEGK
ncbi:MAG: NAD(P)H-dependent oxidoreductase subunit E [Ezakiella sp.]|uniref:NADH-quinone oxidoreductase subunit NuoE family protein n=1 Tax=Ezakiella sp. TaxID=1935205 RepID=UPI0029729565|nr:NAD(P)H-dependent oxidoreductase subunit E [Ezakiella sp.]MDD7730889.1 NAD(P)H-dependent oxidoreductase subunit E [Eubacteriales bacterium]MDY6080373.1 NAD(P)H-dependent oxidoreductase subunit E [Ezakiella sp.]